MRRVLVFLLLIQLTTSNSISPKVVAICTRSNDSEPLELLSQHSSNPSPLVGLNGELSKCHTSFTINWSINIDGSIRSLTGTWITLMTDMDNTYYYRCEYQPPFTSEQNNLNGIQQLHFSFTESVGSVSVRPKMYDVSGYNLPPPSPGSGQEYEKHSSFTTHGSDCKVTTKPLCDQWDADVSSVLHGEKITLTFMTSSMFNRYTVTLAKKTQVLNTIEIKELRKGEKHREELTYTKGCEDLTILITATSFENDECKAALHEVNPTANGSGLTVAVGFVLTFLLILISCYIIRKILGWCKRGGRSADAVCLQLLVVYPAADCAFQHAVTVLAEFLQDCGDVKVVIDMWERERVAEQGLIRWIHTRAELADIILLILPPQHTHAEELKVDPAPVVSHHTVSASASALFALALNLVTGSAHDPRQREKFWVVQLDEMKDKRSVPAEVRGCRTFVLPRDLQKLHQKICSRSNVQRSALKRRFTSPMFNEASWKVKEALEQLEMRGKLLDCVSHTV
ncbi:putative interleukin-17 receptor B-like [Triplophysa rosa]|uniref:Interleukin-17 receptor B-like n=2 Tax=Triplophysa rosa TaxID=992332 RepID=A0A9W7WFN8_TRIRA|nr:putative interleukin-17 receptor B-like [Triplophysa rosa]